MGKNVEEIVADWLSNVVEAIDNSFTVGIKTRTRKRRKEKKEWNDIKRKQAKQSGKAFISKRNKLVPAKKSINKKNCTNNCSLSVR